MDSFFKQLQLRCKPIQDGSHMVWNFINKIVKVPDKKHSKDIDSFSFTKEACMIVKKKDDFMNF